MVVREMADYNYWARDRQLEACAALSEEQFRRPLGGSFPSICDTLVHLLAVEWLWLERWRGRSPLAIAGFDDLTSLAPLAERWRVVERDMHEYVAGLTEQMLEQPMTCRSTRGEEWTYPLWQQVQHLFNHQSYHRGQVTNYLRMLGVVPPRMDFLVAREAHGRRGSARA